MAWTPYNVAPTLEALQSSVRSKKRILIIGDSQFSPDATPRLLIGVRDRFPYPFFGWTAQAGITVSTILPVIQQFATIGSPPGNNTATAAARQFASSTPFVGTTAFAPGSLAISPTHWSERQMGGDFTSSGVMWRCVWLQGVSGADNFASFRNGSWNTQNGSVSLLYYHNGGAPSLTKFDLIPYRNGAQVSGGATITPSGTGVFAATVTCNDSAGNSREPWAQVNIDPSAATEQLYDGTAVANSSLAILGAHFESTDATAGLSLTPISNAGWTAEAHADTALCSDVNLQGYISAVTGGAGFDLVLLMLGHNFSSNEVSGSVVNAQFKTNLNSILSRYNTANTNLGHAAAPWCLVCPWRNSASGGRADTVYDQISQAMYEIARDHSSGKVGHVSLAHACPDSATLNALGYTAGGDFHPQSTAACDFFIDRLLDSLNGGYSTIARARRRIR